MTEVLPYEIVAFATGPDGRALRIQVKRDMVLEWEPEALEEEVPELFARVYGRRPTETGCYAKGPDGKRTAERVVYDMPEGKGGEKPKVVPDDQAAS